MVRHQPKITPSFFLTSGFETFCLQGNYFHYLYQSNSLFSYYECYIRSQSLSTIVISLLFIFAHFYHYFFFSDKEVKEHLTHYLASARELRPETGHLLQVCQLFVHCWEVSFGITIYLKYAVLLLFTEQALYSALAFDLVLTHKRFSTLFILQLFPFCVGNLSSQGITLINLT